ncbi:uncharacterized protein LOC107030178 [Solanum pennellii]|uniref:Uncharacterized protein LOC107030178 n=1 Tax=Solanum pennellii TaxID=28526 RepID=A0ABM1HL13_SOLPN|nr:uncharacterized protein LOC107030178 [Solanum pennellii]
MDNSIPRKRLHALTSSLNHFGDTIGNALEEQAKEYKKARTGNYDYSQQKSGGRNCSEGQQKFSAPAPSSASVPSFKKSARTGCMLFKLTRIRKVLLMSSLRSYLSGFTEDKSSENIQNSVSVAMATAAKGKLLLRELKSVKEYVPFAKHRCCQLEEEKKILRESCSKRDNPTDDDMIQLQLETLLAEKGRLAHEYSVYARENHFLREIVEYHQLPMQVAVYQDEGIQEVTQVSRMHSTSPPTPH